MSEKNAIIGAIIGDIVGSVYEFNNVKSKNFAWFPSCKECRATDDSVLTIAIADSIMETASMKKDKNFEKFFKDKLVESLHYHARNHPFCGFGYGFLNWILCREIRPYNSWGNGSAMRVSPIAYTSNKLEDVLHMAKLSSEVTHNHRKGIKGAQAVAAAIFLARMGYNKKEIRTFIEKEFYDLSFTLDGIRPSYKYDISCDGSVPQAIVSFLESRNFEDAIKNAVSLGGDSDTIAAIAGSIAGAYYPIPEKLRSKAFTYLDPEQSDIVLMFEKRYVS